MRLSCLITAANLLLAAAPSCAQAAEPPPIIILGVLPERAESIAGSFAIIDSAALRRSLPVSAKEALRQAPGVQVVDEDALGLKLNISVRGLAPRRSGRTLLLEDGAPIQPAPYADPSAHHATPIDRIDRIELRKGSGQLLFGPQSIGGTINFVTRPVPRGTETGGRLAIGERGLRSVFASLGTGSAKAGIRLDMLNAFASGTRDFHETEVSEGVVKGGVVLGDHRLTLKAGHYIERSAITESGLDQARYDANPYANPFRSDYFRLDRSSAQLVDDWQIASNARLSTQIYWADTFRASYRQTDTSTDSMSANPATGCIGAARSDYENFAERCGNKMRPRRFRFWGIEPKLLVAHSLWGIAAETILGLRAHLESTNRKRFNGLTSQAREATPGTVLRDDNDIDTRAYAAYWQSALNVGDWTISPGLRLEHVATTNRARANNFVTVDRIARQTQTVLLPGIGLTWSPSPALTAFAGIHRGFAPPRPDRDIDPSAPLSSVRPEHSLETEIGLRFHPQPGFAIDATLFNMELDDLIVEGPLVGGRSGSFVNAGTARHRGIELSGHVTQGHWQASASYTFLAQAMFTSQAGEGSAGVRGNRIPYAPRHMLTTSLGFAPSDALVIEFGLNHIGDQFSDAANTFAPRSDGQAGIIPARTVFRVAGSWAVPGSSFRLAMGIENLLNSRYIATRTDGIFAGPRRQFTLALVERF